VVTNGKDDSGSCVRVKELQFDCWKVWQTNETVMMPLSTTVC